MATGAVPDADVEISLDSVISVLELGVKFSYTIPSFSSMFVDLRPAKFQYECSLSSALSQSSVVVIDGFIKAERSLDCACTPFCIEIKNFCFVPVS